MAWLLLSLILLVLAGLGGVLWQLQQLRRTLLWLANQPPPTPIEPAPVVASPNLEPGTTWIATDRERATLEAQWQQESRQRTGSARSRRTSTPTRG